MGLIKGCLITIGCGVALAAAEVFWIVSSHRDLWYVKIRNTRPYALRLVPQKGGDAVLCPIRSSVQWPERVYEPQDPPFEAETLAGQRVSPIETRREEPFLFFGDGVYWVVY